MKVNWGQTLFGLILGSITPLGLGMLIAMPQGVSPHTFLWAITHFEWYYNSIFQLGVAANIGIFFLLMKKDSWIYFNRGWLLGTILMTIWAVIIELKSF
jgi:hypothetical protein